MFLEPTFLYCSNDDDFRVMTWMETFNSEAFDIQTKQTTNMTLVLLGGSSQLESGS